MSKAVREALRRAQVRKMTRTPADRRGSLTSEPSEPSEPSRSRIKSHAFVLEPAELQALEQLAEKREFAQLLLDGMEDGEISELAAWNARDALEDELGQSWPIKKHRLEGSLGQKIVKLFSEAS